MRIIIAAALSLSISNTFAISHALPSSCQFHRRNAADDEECRYYQLRFHPVAIARGTLQLDANRQSGAEVQSSFDFGAVPSSDL